MTTIDPKKVTAIRTIGGSPGDVVYTQQFEGTFNVTELWKAIRENTVPFVKGRCPILQSHLDAAKQMDVHWETVEGMTLQRRNSPLLVLMCKDGTGFIADGNNRLVRRIKDGCEDFLAYIVSYEDREKFRVTTEALIDGEWKKLDEWEDLTKPILGKHFPQAHCE